jgi:hypothetical protein
VRKGTKKITKKSRKNQRTPSEKNVPVGSNAYLCICILPKEITALEIEGFQQICWAHCATTNLGWIELSHEQGSMYSQ